MVPKHKIKPKNKKRPSSLAERRRRRRLILTIVSFAFLIVAGYGVSKFSFSPTISLSSVKIEGATLVSEDELKEIFEKQTASSYLGLFSKKNIFFLPISNIEDEFTSSFNTIDHADVSFDSLHDVTVCVSERVPSGLWCENFSASSDDISSVDNRSGDECFYVDKSGYIFAEAPKFSGDVFLIWNGFVKNISVEENISEDLSTSFPVGQRLMSQEEFEKLNVFVENVSGVGFKVVSVVEVSDNELEIHLARGGKIIVSRDIDYRHTLENLDSIVAAKQVELKGAFFEKIDTIDIRFSGKAFVKLKAE